MRLDDASLLDEATHKLRVVAVDGRSCNLQAFVQVIADIISDADSDLLVLGLVVDLSGESSLLVGVVN